MCFVCLVKWITIRISKSDKVSTEVSPKVDVFWRLQHYSVDSPFISQSFSFDYMPRTSRT